MRHVRPRAGGHDCGHVKGFMLHFGRNTSRRSTMSLPAQAGKSQHQPYVLALTIAIVSLAGCADPVPEPPAGNVGLPPVKTEASGASIDPDVRNLNGSHTTRVAGSCTIFVAARGNDWKSGRSPDTALRTPTRAVELAQPGDVVCFGAGTYRPLLVEGMHGSADAPIVFRTLPGTERTATFTSGSLDYGGAADIRDSEHIHIYDVRLADSQTGIGLEASAFARVEGVLVENVGQAGIHVGRTSSSGEGRRFLGRESHDIDVIGNTVRGTGNVHSRYGEGVYVGTGGLSGDETHDVLVAYNTIERVRAEGIEVKSYTYDVTVRGNVVAHGSHYFHAGITVGVTPRRCTDGTMIPDATLPDHGLASPRGCEPATDYRDGNYLIEDNRIYDFTHALGKGETEDGGMVAGIGIGHGNALVRNNLVWDIPGGIGIRTYTTFGNAAARRVQFDNNTVWNPDGSGIRLSDGDEGTHLVDQLGEAISTNNLTNDGSAGSAVVPPSRFVGPIMGDADAGRGPGSGFETAAADP